MADPAPINLKRLIFPAVLAGVALTLQIWVPPQTLGNQPPSAALNQPFLHQPAAESPDPTHLDGQPSLRAAAQAASSLAPAQVSR